jgi:Coenzyme PQQ synthesis protein D (PqqD)
VTYDQTMAQGRLPTPADDVVYRELNGEIVLVHLGTDNIYALNETGALFWELLVAGSDRAAIRARLLQEFAVEPAELDVEIDALVAELALAGLVT